MNIGIEIPRWLVAMLLDFGHKLLGNVNYKEVSHFAFHTQADTSLLHTFWVFDDYKQIMLQTLRKPSKSNP